MPRSQSLRERPLFHTVILAFGILFLLTGCAAMFNGSSQQISIRSDNPEAKIFVNEAFVGKGYAVTTFKKKKDYIIRVEQENCEDVTIPATKSFDPLTLLGLPIDFGIVSILIVDGVGTGAWQQFDQTSYLINANCS